LAGKTETLTRFYDMKKAYGKAGKRPARIDESVSRLVADRLDDIMRMSGAEKLGHALVAYATYDGGEAADRGLVRQIAEMVRGNI